MKQRITSYCADLHIHSTLSPCAEREMKPARIFAQALNRGIKILAITDHNSTSNLPAFLRSAPKELWVIPGMEVQTKEEIHMVCLFPGLEQAMEWGRIVHALLPPIPNQKNYFGEQNILNEQGGIVGEEPILLLNSISLSVEETVSAVRSIGGEIYPAHVDRPSFSILSQLGFLPANVDIKVLEISQKADKLKIIMEHKGYSVIRSSDAHFIQQIGLNNSILKIEAPLWEELLLALNHRDKREVITN